MKHELVATTNLLLLVQNKCEGILLNMIFDDVKVISSLYTNFWKFTNYFIDGTSQVQKIDKVQIATQFLLCGAIVEFDGHIYNSSQHIDFWQYLFLHKLISEEEYDFLKNQWGFSDKISFMK